MSRRLKRQLSSKTFSMALVGVASKGAEHVVSNVYIWWIAVGLGLVAWLLMGFFAEDQG